MKAIIIDANLLAIWLVGTISLEYLPRFESSTSFSKEDFYVLNKFLLACKSIYVTPYILCELSHLTLENKHFSDHLKKPLVEMLNVLLNKSGSYNECFPRIKVLLSNPSVFYLGLSDISLWAIGEELRYPVLTQDGPLAEALSAATIDVYQWVPTLGVLSPSGKVL